MRRSAWRWLIQWTCLAGLMVVSLPVTVNAHAHLDRSTPDAGEVVLAAAIPTVNVIFTEPVERDASIFRVFWLGSDTDSASADAAGAELMQAVLPAVARREEVDETYRMDVGLPGDDATSATVTINMKETMPSGAYVVMWRVRSVDTHTTDGYYVFYLHY